MKSSEPIRIPDRIKDMWDEADKKNISVKKIVDTVRQVRSKTCKDEEL